MARKGKGLAARLRAAAMDAKRDARASAAGEEQDRQSARVARAELFEDLLAFARETGLVQSRRVAGAIHLRYEGKQARFIEADDRDGVTLEWTDQRDGETCRLYRETALGNRWVWARTFRGREDRLPFFDQGLEVVMVSCLGMPDPDEDDAVESPEPASHGPHRRGRNL